MCAREAVDDRELQSIFQWRATNTPHIQQLTIETEQGMQQERTNASLHSGGSDIHLGLIWESGSQACQLIFTVIKVYYI